MCEKNKRGGFGARVISVACVCVVLTSNLWAGKKMGTLRFIVKNDSICPIVLIKKEADKKKIGKKLRNIITRPSWYQRIILFRTPMNTGLFSNIDAINMCGFEHHIQEENFSEQDKKFFAQLAKNANQKRFCDKKKKPHKKDSRVSVMDVGKWDLSLKPLLQALESLLIDSQKNKQIEEFVKEVLRSNSNDLRRKGSFFFSLLAAQGWVNVQRLVKQIGINPELRVYDRNDKRSVAFACETQALETLRLALCGGLELLKDRLRHDSCDSRWPHICFYITSFSSLPFCGGDAFSDMSLKCILPVKDRFRALFNTSLIVARALQKRKEIAIDYFYLSDLWSIARECATINSISDYLDRGNGRCFFDFFNQVDQETSMCKPHFFKEGCMELALHKVRDTAMRGTERDILLMTLSYLALFFQARGRHLSGFTKRPEEFCFSEKSRDFAKERFDALYACYEELQKFYNNKIDMIRHADTFCHRQDNPMSHVYN